MPKLTDKLVANMRPEKTRREIPDVLLPGLYLVSHPSGAKSWAVRYRTKQKTRKLTLGRYPIVDLATARNRGADALRKVASGTDPAGSPSQSGKDFAPVLDQFLTHQRRVNKPATFYETRRILMKDVLPRWRDKDIAAIKRSDVHDLLDTVIDRGAGVMANRVLATVGRLFSWAVERGLIETSPCTGMKRRTPQRARERVLDDAEIRAIWLASEGLEAHWRDALRLLILTGQRRGEVGGMRRGEVDVPAKLWTLPADRVKNKRRHEVPLSAQSLAILETRGGDDFVFGRSLGKWSRPVDKLERLLGSTISKPWVVHDIRRSVASGMARIGVPIHVAEKVLNHQSGTFGGIVGVYQRHTFAADVRDALDRWGRHVESVVTGERGVVVNMRRR